MEVEFRIAPLEEVTSSHVIPAMTGKKKLFSAVKMLTVCTLTSDQRLSLTMMKPLF